MSNSNEENNDEHARLKVVVVGCGLGGLACAISCLREGQDVVILEKAPELSEIGAGIQLPPNATRIMEQFGLLDRLNEAGMMARQPSRTLRWQDGSTIAAPPAEWNKTMFGQNAHVMHRADYQRVLVEEARRLGADIRLNCDVVEVVCDYPPSVLLANGKRIHADVVVGADGLRSSVRTAVLGYTKEPEESGDLAYRITIPRELLEGEEDPLIRSVINGNASVIWWGPGFHVVLYTVRHNKIVNLVLICPDNLPNEVSRQSGDLEEMRKLFEDWDPRLHLLLSKVDKALKWKVWQMEPLDTWVKGYTALLGDACHPSPPYAASGAAMAVSDGAVMGKLIGLFARSGAPKHCLEDLMNLYQKLRKERATSTVNLALENRILYHLPDGPEQQKRDRQFAEHDWWSNDEEFPWAYGDITKSKELYSFDVLRDAEERFERSGFGNTSRDHWHSTQDI